MRRVMLIVLVVMAAGLGVAAARTATSLLPAERRQVDAVDLQPLLTTTSSSSTTSPPSPPTTDPAGPTTTTPAASPTTRPATERGPSAVVPPAPAYLDDDQRDDTDERDDTDDPDEIDEIDEREDIEDRDDDTTRVEVEPEADHEDDG